MPEGGSPDKDGGEYDISPAILNAVSEGVEKSCARIVTDQVFRDSDCPEWIKEWLTGEVIPAMSASVECIRIAAIKIERLEKK